MSKHEFLDVVASRHEDLLRMINTFGKVSCAEDLVQEAYIRMDKYCTRDNVVNKDGTANMTYIWFVLRSVFNDYHNQRKKIDKVGIGECFTIKDTIEDEGFEDAYDEILHKINKEKTNWDWYEVKLFDLYTKSDMSMRDIARETTISLSSIFNTIKTCKTRLRNAVGEDWEDFLNGEYDKI